MRSQKLGDLALGVLAAVAEMQHCPQKIASGVSILHSVFETRRNHGGAQ